MPRQQSQQSSLALRPPRRVQPRRRPPAGRRKQQRDNPIASLGQGVLGRLRAQPQSKTSRKGPALLGLLGALGAAGAAGAAMLRRRRSAGDEQPSGYFPPPEPVGEAPAEEHASPDPEPRSA
jgi:hypothetical protein